MKDKLEEYISNIEVVCQSSSSFLAMVRQGKVEDILKILAEKTKVKLGIGKALIKYEAREASLTFVAPNKLIVRMRDSSTLSDVKKFLEDLLGV